MTPHPTIVTRGLRARGLQSPRAYRDRDGATVVVTPTVMAPDTYNALDALGYDPVETDSALTLTYFQIGA